ncbi:acyltransferase [Sphaerisporangium sp. TRM90804]|uniref:acyltransferase family protein n=1 Tax=Sphaerisporangium sp. TRM90804 TaxID=3031113 RepID=UPI002449958B|nr:acyltransferase [Sphaerisporangium sp. TRM90804]MDH2428020.1 acyltransferase [Sphaerisporangium sp. TRM90804]
MVAAAPSGTAGSEAARLGWLDTLRGIGAMAVVAEHMLPWVVPGLRPYWFNLGVYGVLVFFLVSGYIIPTSLERHGDVRAFWVSRLFRLYPLYLAVAGLVLALAWWVPVREAVPRDVSAVAAHATMLLDVVNVGGIVDTMWTLSYEMLFYLLVTAMFTARVHRHSGTAAVFFGAVAVATGVAVSSPWVTGPWVAVGSCAVFLAGMACLVSGRLRTAAAAALGLMALALLLLSSRIPWFGAAVLAVMFAGTAIRRWEEGSGSLWPVAAAAALVVVSPVWAVQAGWWWVQPGVWTTTIALAAATFAAAMAVRRRRMPRFLLWLGVVSYSIYLLHHPLLRYFVVVTGDLRWSPPWVQAAAALAILGLVLGASLLAYRFVEKPMQERGRRLARRLATTPRPETGRSVRSGTTAP